ncbi:uncharacterized protein LOC132695675 [Cylas formicarius]|uniref:uncharacterized protein LOC132695675 n=1 Tax=Cylas formicarius TaxID=197179 RepID=UPI0029588B03|nr:uncharacterized protein LOC132695675 [Cylas formicarius]
MLLPPARRMKLPLLPATRSLPLADPHFCEPNEIDVLLGAEVYGDICLPGFRKGQNGGPCAFRTIFGWVVLGKVNSLEPPSPFSFCTTVSTAVDVSLKRFWELESVPSKTFMSPEDKLCRYVVSLPFKDKHPSLGESYPQALRRFQLLEARLAKNPTLRLAYNEFLRDYWEQGHMALVSDLPPSPLLLHSSSRPKTSNGRSLNDLLFTGSKLQPDIGAILLIFRLYCVVFTTDIRQMYRQILVSDADHLFQRILWRFDPREAVREYVLSTVVYGLSCSPYLAIRVLRQLARDEGARYPLAARLLDCQTYIDDIIGGTDSLEEARDLRDQLVSLLKLGGFELRKWASNSPELLSSLPASHHQPVSLCGDDNPSLKVLGLQWCPLRDVFSYRIQVTDRTCTKRNILSQVAQIYDPLGFLSPVVLTAKILLQRLWSQGVDWDAPPPRDIFEDWSSFSSQLDSLSGLTIPRRVLPSNGVQVETHGFCDASERGYGAAVYLRSVREGHISVTLLCAKNRVAPLKRVSIPRLELCSALLLAQLVDFVRSTIASELTITRVFAWSDSKIALSWIKSSPHRWKTFVANRVSLIQDIISPSSWHHVAGSSNPADCASRGLFPEKILIHPSWFCGPPWLRLPVEEWPTSDFTSGDDLELERKPVLTLVDALGELLTRFSSLRKIERILAYCCRFLNNCRTPVPKRALDNLSFADRYHARTLLTGYVQREVFAGLLKCLRNGKLCAKPLRSLAPFIDEHGLIRVGGRLRGSALSFDAKHPLLLPRDHRFTELVIEKFHKENCHPGPQSLLYQISQQFWILSARRAIRHTLSQCYRCFRVQPSCVQPFMADLPPVRVSQVKPFAHTGVDFAGPISITLARRRGAKTQKAYICLFVCMATKAIHLELASELSSDAFLAAFRRFVARRGRCTDMYSDQGRNFVGANRLLVQYCQQSADQCEVRWHFNPPSSPHFGGLWEAGVKSVKTHLFRVIGAQILTFEEMSTVLTQVESILNSRPLCSLSSNPNDLHSLTPGHFLTLEPLSAPPDDPLANLNTNRLTRWQLVQQLHQHFWDRWHREYLHQLQQRHKWNTTTNPPKVGQLVLIKDENLPPLKWLLGRITRLYPSSDKEIRVVQVHTAKGTFDRPLVKLSFVPNC